MKNLELNKIVASLLVAGLIAMIAGKITDVIYRPEKNPAKRGFEVAVVATPVGGVAATPAAPVEIKIGQLMAAADAIKGQDVAKKCAACHTFDDGGPNRVGPNLHNVVGSGKAAKAGFAYSDALKAKGGKWSYEELFHFINNPKTFAPGTKMTFQGLGKPEEVAEVIAYLKSISPSAPGLPPVEK